MAEPTSPDHRGGVSSPEVLVLVEGYLAEMATRAHTRLGEVLGVAVTTSVAGGEPLTVGASSARAAEVDLVQHAIGHGPCLSTLAGGGEIYVPDLATDPRWQPYGRRAAELGARCSLSVPVVDDRLGILGVAKVYAERVDALDAGQRRTARELALELAGGLGLASSLVSTSLELDDRIEAMGTRRMIDLATGLLMGRLGCDPETAFGLLRRESQNRNTKLHDVAVDLLAQTPAPQGLRPTDEAPFSRRGETPVRGR